MNTKACQDATSIFADKYEAGVLTQDCFAMVDDEGTLMCTLKAPAAPFLACETAIALAVASASSCAESTGPDGCMDSMVGDGSCSGSEDLCSVAYPGVGGVPILNGDDCIGGIGIFGKSDLGNRTTVATDIAGQLALEYL